MKTIEVLIIVTLAVMSLLGVYLKIYNAPIGWFILGSTSIAAYLLMDWLKRNIH